MPLRKLLIVGAIIFCTSIAPAKKKVTLPADVLRAKTVLVIVDPAAGVDPEDPNAQRVARESVEKALDQWGRFERVQEGLTADLVIVVHKGNDRLMQSGIGGSPVNSAPPISGSSTSTPNETTTRGGVRWGQGLPGDPSNAGAGPSSPRPEIGYGSRDDTFVVYRGTAQPGRSPLDAPAVWRYSRKDALASPQVEAVEVFRKVLAESEKQLASQP